MSFPGKNRSAKDPPKMYENNATDPQTENKLPNSIFVKLKTSKKVGLKTLDKKQGSIKTNSPERISKKILKKPPFLF